MKSRITLRIGKILEALTAPAEERGRAGQKEQHRCEREEKEAWKWHRSEGDIQVRLVGGGEGERQRAMCNRGVI